MTIAKGDRVLSEEIWPGTGAALWLKRAVLVAAGVILLALAAKASLPVWPSPVPVTLGTFAVLTIGAAYGARLGLVTIGAYMALGALGFDVFANTGAGKSGLEYMLGATGGYLLGFVLATAALGYLARRGWDRSVAGTALALLFGNALIYAPGLLWLGHLYGWDKPILQWGLWPFLVGDALKLALAALLLPGAWKLVGSART